MMHEFDVINSVEQLLIWVRLNASSDSVFRGQRDATKALKPRIFRPLNLPNRRQLARHLFDEFVRLSTPLPEIALNCEWDFLALAQHHGLSTHLLDWTFNPLAALWFALREDINPAEFASVSLFNGNKVVESTEDPFELTEVKLFLPKQVSARISAQAGCFTAHPFGSDDVVSCGTLPKVRIPISCRRDILKVLDTCGINYKTMFPDLDGLSRHLVSRLVN